MRGFRFPQGLRHAVLLMGMGLLFGFGGNDQRGGYLPESQGVSHYTYVNGEYIPVPYSYSPAPEVSTFHYRNPPVYGANLDQLQGTHPGIYARPYRAQVPPFYR